MESRYMPYDVRIPITSTYRFEIYTGKGGTPDGSPKGVISRLLYGVGATGTSGRMLYTNNFYTSLRVMK
jgi:hypothetical protein